MKMKKFLFISTIPFFFYFFSYFMKTYLSVNVYVYTGYGMHCFSNGGLVISSLA